MLRPQKKNFVHYLRQLKDQSCLTHVHLKSPEEAAGIDLLMCRFDSPDSQPGQIL